MALLGRKDSRKLGPGFLQTSPHVPFPFVEFILHPFLVINNGSEYNYMPSPVSPSELPNVGVVLGDLTHIIIKNEFPCGPMSKSSISQLEKRKMILIRCRNTEGVTVRQ